MKNFSIDNPVFQELLDLNLIKKKNLEIINFRTRDYKSLNVYQDKISKIIFLDKYKKKKTFYEKKKLNRKLIGNKSFSIFNKKKIKTLNLGDQKRRANEFKDRFKNKKVLDFGCGDGGFLKNIKKYTRYAYGIEVNNVHLNKLKNKVKIYQKLEDIDFKLDFITLFHVLEHLPSQIKILKSLKKKLKKNGKLILEVPHANDFLLRLNHKEFKNFTFWSEHLILHTEKSIKKFLFSAGFNKIKVNHYQRYDLSNHAGWINDKKPGGHLNYSNLFHNSEKELYNEFLINTGMTDTLLIEATI